MKTKTLGLVALVFLLVCCKETVSKTIAEEKPENEEERTGKEVNIVFPDLPEDIAVTFLVKTILEENLQYEVNLKMAELDKAFEDLSAGEHDLILNAWLPDGHREYFKKNEKNLSLAGTVYADAEIGFLVPEGAEIENIEDIKQYSDTIYRFKSSAGIMLPTQPAIDEYELEVNLIEEDEEKIRLILDEKFKRSEAVVIIGWKPHHLLSRYELKFLKDPKNVFPRSERIYAVVNNGFSARDKVLMEFFSGFSLTQKQFLSLIEEVKSNPSGEEAGAKEWIKDHRPLVSEWIKNLDEFEGKPM